MKYIKNAFKGLYMSLGMFCAIPLPKSWDASCMHLTMPCLPVVGALIGAMWWGVAELLVLCGLHTVLASAVLASFPFIITGFIHLDGYMDTSDAVLSRRSQDDKLRILKDPHTGSFAVIMLALVFIMQFAAAFAVIENGKHFSLLIVISVVSRCGAAVSVLFLKPIAQSMYAKIFKKDTGLQHKAVAIYFAACSVTAAWLIADAAGIAVAAATALGYLAGMAFSYKSLRGVSGDLAGFSLVLGELCGLIAFAVIY